MKELVEINGKTFKLFISQEEITERIDILADVLNTTQSFCKPVFLCILKGSFMFATELIKRINFDCEIEFLKVSSYDGMKRGKIKVFPGLEELELEGRNVYILEDIVDSGSTILTLEELLKNKNVNSIKTLSLLYKPHACTEDIIVDYSCFDISNEFVVGFGLDYNQLGRNLPNIYQEC